MTDPKRPTVNFADCYVLSPRRTAAFIRYFLDHFLPGRRQTATRYPVPQYADAPTVVFTEAEALTWYLEKHPEELHAIYWSNTAEGTLRGAMCHFTGDGQVILGLYCETLFPDPSNEERYFQNLQDFCGSNTGLIEYRTPAANDTPEFLERVQAYRRQNRLREER